MYVYHLRLLQWRRYAKQQSSYAVCLDVNRATLHGIYMFVYTIQLSTRSVLRLAQLIRKHGIYPQLLTYSCVQTYNATFFKYECLI